MPGSRLAASMGKIAAHAEIAADRLDRCDGGSAVHCAWVITLPAPSTAVETLSETDARFGPSPDV